MYLKIAPNGKLKQDIINAIGDSYSQFNEQMKEDEIVISMVESSMRVFAQSLTAGISVKYPKFDEYTDAIVKELTYFDKNANSILLKTRDKCATIIKNTNDNIVKSLKNECQA